MKPVVAAAAVAATLSLTACGGDPGPAGSSLPAFTASATAVSAEAPIAGLTGDTLLPTIDKALAEQSSWRIFGMLKSGPRLLMTLRGTQTVKPPAADLEVVDEDRVSTKLVVVNKVGYVSSAGSGYQKFTPGADEDVDALLNLGDPHKLFRALDHSVVALRYAGPETIVGQQTQRYSVTVDTLKSFKAQGSPAPANAPATMTYNLWFDKAQRVRRLELDQAGVAYVLTLSDFNNPVTITAPPLS